MLKKLVNSKFGRASALSMMLALPFSASAEDTACAPLKKSASGYTMDSHVTARSFSEENKGEVAISTIPGSDVGNTPVTVANLFEKGQIPATCFINDKPLKSGGTQFKFYVAGIAVIHKGETEFGIRDIVNDPEILQTVANQAKTSVLANVPKKNEQVYTLANN